MNIYNKKLANPSVWRSPQAPNILNKEPSKTDVLIDNIYADAKNTLYCASILMRITDNYLRSLREWGLWLKNKENAGKIIDRHRDFLNELTKNLQPTDRAAWLAEFHDRDVEVYSSILFSLHDMTEVQRAVVEEFITQFKAGNIQVAE